MENIVNIDRISKSYPDFTLNNISFGIKTGITGFVGINGSGKTTTIKIMTGLTKPSSGTVEYWNKKLECNEQEIKNRIGVVLGINCFYDNMTINEMKKIVSAPYTNWDENLYKNYLKKFSLKPDLVIENLSQGMKMKLALTFALSHHSDLLILDEPTNGLDLVVKNQIMDILLEFGKADGKAILFSTHITADLDRIADRLIFIDNGKILLSETKENLYNKYSVVDFTSNELNYLQQKNILNYWETNKGYRGIIENKYLPINNKIFVEVPKIEDIFLGILGGRTN